MTDLMKLPRLGLGCWPLSGPFFHGTRALGYANADPDESLRALDAAYAEGIRIFDTAAVYGAGKGERLVGKALVGRKDAFIVSKIGLAFDEATEQLIGVDEDASHVAPAIDACLKRLGRDKIDLLLLHPNEIEIAPSEPIFDALEQARRDGKIDAFGWSTDFPDKVEAHVHRDGFTAVEHAMNVFFRAEKVRKVTQAHGLASLLRSPLAMGLLSGKYDAQTPVGTDDVRGGEDDFNDFFVGGRANPDYLAQIAAVRELLQTGGRSLVQGALCWCMAAGENTIPLPGARTVEQVRENAGALAHGPLPVDIMEQIEQVLDRPPEGAPRIR